MQYEITVDGNMEITSGELTTTLDPMSIEAVDVQDGALILFTAESVTEIASTKIAAKAMLEQLLGAVTPAARVNINFILSRLNTLHLINNRI